MNLGNAIFDNHCNIFRLEDQCIEPRASHTSVASTHNLIRIHEFKTFKLHAHVTSKLSMERLFDKSSHSFQLPNPPGTNNHPPSPDSQLTNLRRRWKDLGKILHCISVDFYLRQEQA